MKVSGHVFVYVYLKNNFDDTIQGYNYIYTDIWIFIKSYHSIMIQTTNISYRHEIKVILTKVAALNTLNQ